MTAESVIPNLHANFFWTAPIGSGDCLRTNNQAIKIVGANFGFIKMPIINGNEAMLKIKQAKPNLPIIALSAFAMESDKENALNKGFDAYLTKPIDRKKIFELINHYANFSS